MMAQRSVPRFISIAVGLAATACAGATTQAGRTSCELTRADSVYLERGPVYRDCAVDRRARLETTDIRPDFQSTQETPGSRCYSALIELVVDTSGVPEPETAKVVRTNNDPYAVAVLAIVPRWRYAPARKDGAAVRQIVRERQAMVVQVVQVRAGDIPRPGSAPGC